jgi:hypothetical protein
MLPSFLASQPSSYELSATSYFQFILDPVFSNSALYPINSFKRQKLTITNFNENNLEEVKDEVNSATIQIGKSVSHNLNGFVNHAVSIGPGGYDRNRCRYGYHRAGSGSPQHDQEHPCA